MSESDFSSNKEQTEENVVLYKVEKILDMKVIKEKTYYLIKWLEWPEDFNSWEDKATLKNIKNLITEFEEKKGIFRNAKKSEKNNEENFKKAKNLKKLQKNNPLYGHFKYGDKPFMISEVEISNNSKKDRVELLCIVKWQKRNSGVTPLDSAFTNSYLRKKAPVILIDFFETKIKVCNERNADFNY